MHFAHDSIREVKNEARRDGSVLQFQKQKAELVKFLKNQRPRKEPDRVRVVTKLDRVLHQSCYTKPIKYYFTTGRKVLCPRAVEKERSPYFIDAYLRTNEKVHLDKIQKLPNHLKPSRRDKAVIGLNDRLYIPRTDPDYPSPRSIVKTSPDYYKIISGRQNDETTFFKKSVYIKRLKKTFLTRFQEAVEEEAQFVDEKAKLGELCSLVYVRNSYIKTINLFNRFLFENMDEKNAVSYMADTMGKLVELKSTQIESAGNALGNIKDSLVSMDSTLQQLRLSKIVLDELAPDYWKRDYATVKNKLKPIADKAADYVLQMFAYFKLEIPLPDKGLEKLVLRLANTIRNLGPPALYFKRPPEVPLALKKLEHSTVIAINTLNIAYTRTEEVIKEDKEIQREQRKILNMLQQEIDGTKNEFISRMSQILTVEEETGVIMSYMRAVMTNPDLLQAFVQIKLLYDEFVGDDAPTKDIIEMLSVLTEKIINTQMEVNNLPLEETERIYNELKNRDDLIQKHALAARKRKEEAEKMLKTLKKQYENRFSRPGLPQQQGSLQTEEELFVASHPIPPPNEEVSRKVLKIFQSTKPKDAFFEFLDTVDKMKKIEKKLEEVKYPPAQPKFDKKVITQPAPSASSSFCFKESLADDLSDLPSSYIANAKATVKECDTSDLSV